MDKHTVVSKLVPILCLIALFGCEKSDQYQSLKHSWILTEWKVGNSETDYLSGIELSSSPCPATSYTCLKYKLTFRDSNKYQVIYDFGQSEIIDNGRYIFNEESIYFYCSGHHPCMIWNNYSRNFNYLTVEISFHGDTLKSNQLFIRDY